MDSPDHHDRRCFPDTQEQYITDITNWVTESVNTLRSSVAPLPETTRQATRHIIQNHIHCINWGHGDVSTGGNLEKAKWADLEGQKHCAKCTQGGFGQKVTSFDRPLIFYEPGGITYGRLYDRDEEEVASNEPGQQKPTKDGIGDKLADFKVAQHLCELRIALSTDRDLDLDK